MFEFHCIHWCASSLRSQCKSGGGEEGGGGVNDFRKLFFPRD